MAVRPITSRQGLGWKAYAWVFAIATAISMGVLLPGVQANSIASGLQNSLNIEPAVSAAVMVVLLGLIIFGGVKRIAKFTEIVVPFAMALGYILVACTIVGLNISKVPEVLRLIVSSALGIDAGFGAITGLAIQWGVKRGVFSNEAGQGSSPHPAAAAEVSIRQSKASCRLLPCTWIRCLCVRPLPSLILITGLYNVKGVNPGSTVNNLPGVGAGPGFTQAAVESALPGFGSIFVAAALFFFAFTTIVAYYYIADTNVAYMNRKMNRPWLSFLLKVIMLASVLFGSVRSAELAWTMGDIGVGVMAWLNIVAILFLQRPALQALRDWESKHKAGEPIV